MKAAAGSQGTVSPAVAGATVQLQQQMGTSWAPVSSTVTDSTGAWSFAGPLQPGSYRIRCAPGHGLVPGVSATLVVP